MAQFGVAADPASTKAWDVPIQDDPVKTSNVRGTVTFAATNSPNSRSTQVFINFAEMPVSTARDSLRSARW